MTTGRPKRIPRAKRNLPKPVLSPSNEDDSESLKRLKKRKSFKSVNSKDTAALSFQEYEGNVITETPIRKGSSRQITPSLSDPKESFGKRDLTDIFDGI